MRISTIQKPLTKGKAMKLLAKAKVFEVKERLKGKKVKTIYSKRLKKLFK